MSRKPTTYWDYIRVESLLSLQGGLDGDERELDNDEVLFIVVHQIDELWFKLILRELVQVRDLFASTTVPEQSMASAVRGLRRASELLRMCSEHFRVIETITTRDYLAFRDKLSPASGFQSAQMREIEILAGLPMDERIPLGNESYLGALKNPDGSPSPASERVAARLTDTPSLREVIDEWLWRTPVDGSTPDDAQDAEVVSKFRADYLASLKRELDGRRRMAIEQAGDAVDAERLKQRYEREYEGARAYLHAEELPEEERRRAARLRAAAIFIESYRELPLLAWPRELLEALVVFEQAFVIFRQRHARMVERVIGRRTGTGGSAGVDYLDATATKYRIFRELWAARTILVRKVALPELARPEFYAFAGGR